ncbi:MAG: ATP-binding protein [Nitrospiraceae bacterium]
MQGSLTGWFRHLTIGQKFVVSFGVMLTLLLITFAALLFYLARVNSYVDRHQRITVPAVITAATMQQDLSRLREHVHHLVEHHSSVEQAVTIKQIDALHAQMTTALDTYRNNHAARTHPILFSMLTQHQRVDLADQEDQATASIVEGLKRFVAHRNLLTGQLANKSPDAQPHAESIRRYEETMTGLERAINALVDVHRNIDMEMKLEGDRLVNEARLVVLGVVALLGLLIVVTYTAMRRAIAQPLRRLAMTADRVAHQDLNAHFEPWPNRDEVGTLASAVSTMVTNLREQTAMVVRKTKELEAFTYSIAHDLKGPLREIEGFSSLLEKQLSESTDVQTRHHIDVIRRSALRLTHMIDALLKYSRLEQQNLPRIRFDVLELIGSLVGERLGHAQDPKPSIHIDLPFADLFGEPVSIRQALVNVLDNAAKFSRRASPPEIRIGGRQTATERLLWVQDNGIGFDMGQKEKIFGLFERLHSPQEYEGTGVGLAIVKMVMEKHGGRVWVDSAQGQGTTVFLAFPDQVG